MASASLLVRADVESAPAEEFGAHQSPSAGAARGELRVLLATDPFGTSSQAQAAIEQLARVTEVLVDVVHVVKPGGLTRQLWQQLHVTLVGPTRAMAHYVVEDGDPAAGVARVCSSHDYDLIMAPASRHKAPWRPWRRSVRAAIVRRSTVPVWTTGVTRSDAPPARQIRKVACYLCLETGGDAHLQWAADFSKRVGARLHLLHVVPPIDDGTIADAFASDRPLAPAIAHERVRGLMANGIDAHVQVVIGARCREVRRLVDSAAIDLLCISTRDALCGRQMSPGLLALPCPVVCCH